MRLNLSLVIILAVCCLKVNANNCTNGCGEKENRGNCVLNKGCSCSVGWSGESCDKTINPCKNNGTDQLSVIETKINTKEIKLLVRRCNCLNGWTSRLCDVGRTISFI